MPRNATEQHRLVGDRSDMLEHGLIDYIRYATTFGFDPADTLQGDSLGRLTTNARR